MESDDVTAYYIVMNFVIWAWDLLFVDDVQPIGNDFKTDLRMRMYIARQIGHCMGVTL